MTNKEYSDDLQKYCGDNGVKPCLTIVIHPTTDEVGIFGAKMLTTKQIGVLIQCAWQLWTMRAGAEKKAVKNPLNIDPSKIYKA